MKGSIDISGIEQVASAMKALSGFPEQRQLIQAAGRKAARVYVRAAKASVARVSGELRRSIGTKSARKGNSVIAGPRRGGKWKGYHGHLYEDGFRSRSGRMIQGKGKLEQAWKATSGQVRTVQIQEIGKQFGKYADKALRRK